MFALIYFSGLRYFLLRQGVPHSDGNYNQELLVNCLNSELANTLGNLLSRITSKSINLDQSFYYPYYNQTEECSEATDVRVFLHDLPQKVEIHYENFDFYLGNELRTVENVFFTFAYTSHRYWWHILLAYIAKIVA